MTMLIAYASKHGSTQEIAERIAEKLQQMGKKAERQANVSGSFACIPSDVAIHPYLCAQIRLKRLLTVLRINLDTP